MKKCERCSWPLMYLGPLGRHHWHRCIGCGTEYTFDAAPPIAVSPGVPDELMTPTFSDGNGHPKFDVRPAVTE